MYRLNDLRHYTIGATDGEVGQVETVYFDDESWTVRYLVVDTGHWLSGRTVLITPRSIRGLDADRQRIVTTLTREQVETSPDIDTHKPVSRQDEVRYFSHYGYPDYWTGPYRWGLWTDPYIVAPSPLATPASRLPPAVARELAARETAEGDPHLQSASEVIGNGIQATDGDLGHVEDFLVDVQTWTIRYLIVDPQNWWPGPHVLLSPEWIIEVTHEDRKVVVDLSREDVRSAPVYDPNTPIQRDWESRLHGHFDRRGYWERSAEAWRLRPPPSP